MLDRGKVVFAETLRALPFEQDCRRRAAGWIRTGCAGPTTSTAGTTTGPGPRPTSSRRRCARSSLRRDFLDDNYLSTELRVPVTLLQTNACSPLATNAHRAATSGTTSRRRPTRTCRRSAQITVYDPFTGDAATVRDAGRRPRLHPAAVADQPVVDRAVPAEQHASGRSSPIPSVEARMRVVRRLDRADAVAGEARARTRCWATRCRA